MMMGSRFFFIYTLFLLAGLRNFLADGDRDGDRENRATTVQPVCKTSICDLRPATVV